jgi:hypothetical protein
MTETEQPSTPPLTRRQLRELRNTGATPVLTTEPGPEPPVAPLPRPAEPAPVAALPVADASVDLEAAPLTRRQAREQERIRTASISVIPLDGPPVTQAPAAADLPVVTAERALAEDVPAADDDAPVTVSERLGSALLHEDPVPVEMPPSFDQVLTRDASTSGSTVMANALILSQAPAGVPLVGPIAATGELLVTGTLDLPEGLGSRGHAPGTTDGKEADAVLVDGELPAASSPTPIAASAAISTVRNADEIIRPPAPERGGRLMLVLAITAGALAVALVGVLTVAVITGAFS